MILAKETGEIDGTQRQQQRHRCDQQGEVTGELLNSIESNGVDGIYVPTMSAIKAPMHRVGNVSWASAAPNEPNIAMVNIRHPATSCTKY